MTVTKTQEEGTITLAISGRLDTLTSTQLSEQLSKIFESQQPSNFIFDLANLDYISSAGLRILLAVQKKVNEQGMFMRIINVQNAVREVFEITGFCSVMTIE